MVLSELYQEPKGGTFTHDDYDLNTIFRLVDKQKETAVK